MPASDNSDNRSMSGQNQEFEPEARDRAQLVMGFFLGAAMTLFVIAILAAL